ncbi:hypothetical protein ACQEWB_37930 [Streptomyces sp. CA-249302]
MAGRDWTRLRKLLRVPGGEAGGDLAAVAAMSEHLADLQERL